MTWKPTKTLTRLKLADELGALLNIPRGRHPENRKDPSLRIVNAIIQVLTTTLRTGEPIYIRGLGTFKVRDGQPHHYRPILRRGFRSPVPIFYPGKKTVVFYPSPALRKAQPHDHTEP